MEDGNGPPASCPFWSALSPNTKWEEEENPVSFAFFISPFIQPLFSFFFFFHRNTCDSFGPRTGRKTPKKNEEREREETVKDTSERRRKRFFFFFKFYKKATLHRLFPTGPSLPVCSPNGSHNGHLAPVHRPHPTPPNNCTRFRPSRNTINICVAHPPNGQETRRGKNRKIGFSLTCKCVDFGV